MKTNNIFLGSPMSAGQHLDSILARKKEELQRLTRRLELMPTHDSLFMLRNVLAAPRLMYLLRTSPAVKVHSFRCTMPFFVTLCLLH